MGIDVEELQSRSELNERMRFLDRPVVLRSDVEAPKRYYIIRIGLPSGSTREFGLVSNGVSGKPSVQLFADQTRAAIGVDSSVTVVDLRTPMPGVEGELRLDGVFFEFVATPTDKNVVALHELGVLAVGVGGLAKWSVSTDVVNHRQVLDKKWLVLSDDSGGAPLRVDLTNGRAKLIGGVR